MKCISLPAPGARELVPRRRNFSRMYASSNDSNGDSAPRTKLEDTIRRKQESLQSLISDMGMEQLEEKLQDAVRSPAQVQYRVGTLMGQHMSKRRATLIAEVPRLTPDEPSSNLADRAARLIAAGVDVLCVKTDASDTPTGLQDLFAVVQAAPRTPVLRRDWFIHPLQVIEAKEAGAAGILGIICQVSGKGTPVMSSFASAMGLDAPVEVVNKIELEFLVGQGVPVIAMNCGVGLSLSIPGLAADIASGLLGELPPLTPSVVGVKTVDEGIKAWTNGASCLLLKAELLQQVCGSAGDCSEFMDSVRYALSGDD